jgi:hypothetical protein
MPGMDFKVSSFLMETIMEFKVQMLGLQSNAIFELFIVVPALLRTTLVSL